MATEQTLYNHVASSFATEALACLEAMRIGANLRFQRVSILKDARSIIVKSRSERRDKSEISAIIHRIQEQKKRFQSIDFFHISKEFNVIAHNLALAVLRSNQDTYMVNDGRERNHDERL